MTAFGLSLDYLLSPLLQIALAWYAFAFLVGGAWTVCDWWGRGRVDWLPWNAICYGWPTAMMLVSPLTLGSLRWIPQPWADLAEVCTIVYIVVNIAPMMVSILFAFSPCSVALMGLSLCVGESAWLFMAVFAVAFWATWFVTLRHLEERWTYRTSQLHPLLRELSQ